MAPLTQVLTVLTALPVLAITAAPATAASVSAAAPPVRVEAEAVRSSGGAVLNVDATASGRRVRVLAPGRSLTVRLTAPVAGSRLVVRLRAGAATPAPAVTVDGRRAPALPSPGSAWRDQVVGASHAPGAHEVTITNPVGHRHPALVVDHLGFASPRPRVGSVSGFSPGGGFPFLSVAQLAKELDGIKATGAAWVRVDFPWTTMEPTRGQYNWANLDRVTAAAAARGIKVLALPAYSPDWARPGCSTDKCPPANPDDYARFVAEAARHYGPDRVQAWELWNEPNIPSFWSPRPDTDAYAVLLTKAAAALKAARPGAFVLSAGLSPAYTDGTNVAPIDFVKRLYALGAMRNVDAVAIHPYSDKYLPLTPGTESWNTFLQMKTVHDIMTANGDGAKKVWGTEFGVATGTSAQSTSESQQAAIIQQGFAKLADGSWPWLGTLFAYSLRDHANNISDWQSNYGLTRNDGSPKPAYLTFTQAMTAPLTR